MSEHELEFIKRAEAILLRMKRLHQNTIKVVIIVSSIVCIFGGVVIVQGYSTTRDSTKALTIIDTQTLTLAAEAKDRELSDQDLKVEIKRLEAKIDTNLKWLLENLNSKSRGQNPMLEPKLIPNPK